MILEHIKVQEDGVKKGMVVDYSTVGKIIGDMVEKYLDHYHLNESLGFDFYPTSENIAKWVYDHLASKLPYIRAVIIEETCTCRVEYRPATS